MNVSHIFPKELTETGCKVVFKFTANMKSILCDNKLKPLSTSYTGVHQLGWNDGGYYIGGTKKCVYTIQRESRR